MRQFDTMIAQILPAEMSGFPAWGWAAGGILALAAVLYLALTVWLFLAQDRLTYLPSHELWQTPREEGLTHEEVWLEAGDGVRIHGWFISAGTSAERTVLFCHGNAGNISDRIGFAAMLVEWGCNVLLFDYRGYGQSQGSPNEKGTYADAHGAWRFLTETMSIPAERIILFGRSLGAAVAAELASHTEPAALILESGFTSLPDIGAHLYPYMPVRLIARNRYPTLERIGKIKTPVLIAHSREDELIPFDHSLRIFAAANEPKEFFEMTGSHAEGVWHSGESYQAAVRSFISRVPLKIGG